MLRTRKTINNLSEKEKQKLINQNRNKYKITCTSYKKTGPVIQLERKNDKGYYNIICYLKDDKEETINEAIIKNIITEKEKKPLIDLDDDI